MALLIRHAIGHEKIEDHSYNFDGQGYAVKLQKSPWTLEWEKYYRSQTDYSKQCCIFLINDHPVHSNLERSILLSLESEW